MLYDFAQEVLKDQPKDIYEYGAKYFKAMEEVRLPIVKLYLRSGDRIPLGQGIANKRQLRRVDP